MHNLEKLNGGFGLTIKKKNFIGHCESCKAKLNLSDFFWCDQNKKFYCRKCDISHNIWKSHTDWHIIDVKYEEDET